MAPRWPRANAGRLHRALTSPQWYATRISCLPCPRSTTCATGSRLKIGKRSLAETACSLLAPNPSSLHPVARRDVNGAQCCAHFSSQRALHHLLLLLLLVAHTRRFATTNTFASRATSCESPDSRSLASCELCYYFR